MFDTRSVLFFSQGVNQLNHMQYTQKIKFSKCIGLEATMAIVNSMPLSNSLLPVLSFTCYIQKGSFGKDGSATNVLYENIL